jgi:hypothetical protein
VHVQHQFGFSHNKTLRGDRGLTLSNTLHSFSNQVQGEVPERSRTPCVLLACENGLELVSRPYLARLESTRYSRQKEVLK